jgi:2-polyprenyl-3-methyl-5-hydroxy-6-metoxy-1,4-benzoquinol methylase
MVEHGVIAGNVYDKQGTRNPIARALVRGFQRALLELVRTSGARRAHEVGCGEGHLAVLLSGVLEHVRASDISARIIEEARRVAAEAGASVDLSVASIYELEPERDGEELIVCCEVLEHLERPDEALDLLARAARSQLLVSVPREPLWRMLNMARGRYLRALGNTPGHLNHWSRRSFLAFLSSRVEVVAVRSPLPWTMALCRYP